MGCGNPCGMDRRRDPCPDPRRSVSLSRSLVMILVDNVPAVAGRDDDSDEDED